MYTLDVGHSKLPSEINMNTPSTPHELIPCHHTRAIVEGRLVDNPTSELDWHKWQYCGTPQEYPCEPIFKSRLHENKYPRYRNQSH